MRRTIVFGLAACAALFALCAASGTVDALKPESSSPTIFTIDGMSFRSDASGPGDAALLRRELHNLGVTDPEALDFPEEPPASNPAFAEKLVGTGQARPTDTPEIPRGLTREHALRMSGGNRTVDLVFGRMDSGGSSVSARLAADGWIPVSIEGTASPRMLQRSRGKETTVVCLDDREGTFLLFRRLER
jgi:hypothetical protein